MKTISALLAHCAEDRSPVNYPHKGQWRGAFMFSWSAWINGWVDNREPSDLRRHRAHCDDSILVPWRKTMSSEAMLEKAVRRYQFQNRLLLPTPILCWWILFSHWNEFVTNTPLIYVFIWMHFHHSKEYLYSLQDLLSEQYLGNRGDI